MRSNGQVKTQIFEDTEDLGNGKVSKCHLKATSRIVALRRAYRSADEWLSPGARLRNFTCIRIQKNLTDICQK